MDMRIFRPRLFLFSAALLAAAVPLSARADDTHEVQTPEVTLSAGTAGKVSVTVAGKNGWHVNEEAPITLKLTAPEGVTLGKDRFGRADLAESRPERARFDVEVTVASAGVQTVTGEARFVMCQESACKPVKQVVTLALNVHAPKGKPARKK